MVVVNLLEDRLTVPVKFAEVVLPVGIVFFVEVVKLHHHSKQAQYTVERLHTSRYEKSAMYTKRIISLQ